MTYYQFYTLNEDEQANAIWAHGVLIGSRETEDCKVLLYQIDAFYVEIYFNPFLRDIIRIKGFPTTQQLEPYVEQIDISELIS